MRNQLSHRRRAAAACLSVCLWGGFAFLTGCAHIQTALSETRSQRGLSWLARAGKTNGRGADSQKPRLSRIADAESLVPRNQRDFSEPYSSTVSRTSGEIDPSPGAASDNTVLVKASLEDESTSVSTAPKVPPPPTSDGTGNRSAHDPVDEPVVPKVDGGDLGSGALTVDDFVQMALQNNPSIQQATAVVHKAQGVQTQVGLYPNPTIGYFNEEMGDDGTAGKQGGFLSQTIVTGDKLRLNRAVASGEIQRLLWEREAQRRRVENDVRSQFFESLGAKRRVELTVQLKTIATEGVAVADELLAAGQGTLPDVLQSKVQLGEVDILHRNAEIEYEAAWKRLLSLVGTTDLPPTELAGELTEQSAQWTWEEAYEQILAQSPELQAAYARVNRACALVRRQEAQPIPNLLTQFGVAHDYASGDDVANVQLGIPVPIFNKNQGNRCVAAAEYRRALRDAQRLRLSLRARLADTYRQYQTAQNQVDRYRDDILLNAEKNLKLTDEGYERGQFDSLRVLTARRMYFETNLAYVRALIDLRQAEVALSGLLLSGGLSDVPDISQGPTGIGSRGQALSGQ